MTSAALTTIDIGICTFRRQQVAATLRSLSKLTLPAGQTIRVIVADNDDTPSAQSLVETTAKSCNLNVIYIHAPARNISIARNACLDVATAPLFAFIDDDEEVTAEWLQKLLSTLSQSEADVVLGPVKALYDNAAPQWMCEGDFHSFQPVWVGGRIITGYTSNVLFRRDASPLLNRRFSKDLGQSGGEDTSFFTEAYKAGAKFAYAADAIVTEIVPANRATFEWLFKRRFRSGQTHGLLLKKDANSSPLRNLFAASFKVCMCALAACLYIFCKKKMYKWILRGALHAGVISSLLGSQSIKIYGSDAHAS